MRTIRTKVYKFNELSKPAQIKAIDGFRDINIDFDQWHEPILEGAKEDLEAAGYNEPEIHYSGFSSQGDGACFECTSIDFNKFLKGKWAKYADKISADIKHNWRYYFANSTDVNLYDDEDKLPQAIYNAIEQDIKDEREREGNKIYRALEKYYWELQEDEAVIEAIESNDYEFTKEGKQFHS